MYAFVFIVCLAVKGDDEESSQNNSNSFLFKSSWLERLNPSPIIVGLNTTKPFNYFKVGDRVQLNFGTWLPFAIETCGKCLGTPLDYQYGIVYSEGCVKDGVQRNIEVYCVSELNSTCVSPHISLYPSYALVRANLGAVIQSGKQVESLVNMLTEVCPFQVAAMFKTNSLQVNCLFDYNCLFVDL